MAASTAPAGRCSALSRRRSSYAGAAAGPSLLAGLRPSLGQTGIPVTATGPTAAQLSGYRWSELPPSPLGRTSGSITAWAGRELLQIGSERNARHFTASAAYDPASSRWHLIAPEPRFVNPQAALTVWTGRQLLVIGTLFGCDPLGQPGTCVPQAELYDPAVNQWSTTHLPRSLGQRGRLKPLAATWTGSQIVVAGGNTTARLAVAAYSPATRHWQVITPRSAAHPLSMLAGLVFAGHHLLLWTSWISAARVRTDVFSRNAQGSWTDLTAGWPLLRIVSAPVLNGPILVPPNQLLIGSHGFFINPATLAVTDISAGPLGKTMPAYFWTGRTVIAVDTSSTAGKVKPGATADYDPATRQWHSLPDAAGLFPPKGFPEFAAPPVWTGTQLLALTDNGGLLAFHR